MTPTNATPTKLAMASQNSADPTATAGPPRRWSMSDRPAAMTTAASVAVGRFARRPGAAISMTPIRRAATTEVSWVWAPAASATGVRDALVLIGIPEKKPVAMFAPPSAISSRSWSTSSPRRIEKVLVITLVSVAATSAIPSAAGTTARMSSIWSGGRLSGGSPTGSGPTTATSERAVEVQGGRQERRSDDRDQDARAPSAPTAAGRG